MKNNITIPSMGESITEATVGEILKSPGSFVKTDEEILELETDKVNQVLYAPSAGALSLPPPHAFQFYACQGCRFAEDLR